MGSPDAYPSQERFRGNDGGNFMENATTDLPGLGCQAPVLVVVRAQSLAFELLPKDAILFARMIERVSLLLVESAGDRN
jgi:hypothetical protein